MIDSAHLTAIQLFADLPHNELHRLAAIGEIRSAGEGSLIFQEGDPAEGLFAVITGRVKVFKSNPSGKELILHIFGPGEMIGEAAVFSGRSFPAACAALEPTRLVFFPRDRFRRLLEEEPELAMHMLGLLSARLRAFTATLEALSLKEVPARLATHLLLLAASSHADTFDLDLPKGTLASLLGTIPETLSRVIRKLQDQDIVQFQGARVAIRDKARLMEIAAGLERI